MSLARIDVRADAHSLWTARPHRSPDLPVLRRLDSHARTAASGLDGRCVAVALLEHARAHSSSTSSPGAVRPKSRSRRLSGLRDYAHRRRGRRVSVASSRGDRGRGLYPIWPAPLDSRSAHPSSHPLCIVLASSFGRRDTNIVADRSPAPAAVILTGATCCLFAALPLCHPSPRVFARRPNRQRFGTHLLARLSAFVDRQPALSARPSRRLDPHALLSSLVASRLRLARDTAPSRQHEGLDSRRRHVALGRPGPNR